MNFKKIIKYIILFFGYVILLFGLYSGAVIITGEVFGFLDTVLNVLFPALACFSYLFFPVIMIVMIRLHPKKYKLWLVPLFLGLVVIFMNAMPLIGGIQKPITEGEAQFQDVFGANYMDKIDADLRGKMRDNPFDFWKIYYGFDELVYNVSYNEGPYLTVPVYNDEFYFDYYCPTTGSGPFPTIINIHGGAWVLGNKGIENLVYFSRYFAQQGYAVFDIQYGLGHVSDPNAQIYGMNVDEALGMVQGLLGRDLTNKSYNVPEMITQVVGNFTDYLAANANKYKVNTSCVFVTGLSAGGHLTQCFIGWNNTWSHIFNDSLTIKGIIPRYGPADMGYLFQYQNEDPLMQGAGNFQTLMADVMGGNPYENDSLDKLISLIYYVDESAPPCLIFQGEQDEMVPLEIAYELKAAYKINAENPCILITFPFHGHAFDFVPNSPGAQIMLYYWERFMGLLQNEVI
jgi:acetyl esterase/lipase